jgi:uncharacterized protein (TIGR01777 family)
MRILITGGTGLVGRALAKNLVDRDHAVVILSRGEGASKGFPDGVSICRWDARSVDVLVEHVERADAVVHLAGENIGDGRWTASRKRRILTSRVDSTCALTEALRRAKQRPQVLVQASAVGFYGTHGDVELKEDHEVGADFLAQVCQAWEQASADVPALGMRRVVMRTGVVLSRDGGALPRMALPFRLFVGGPVGSGRQWVSWIHLIDLVEAIVHLIDNEKAEGVYNLCAPQAVTNRRFSRELATALGRPSLLRVPAFMLRLLLGEMATIVLDGQRAVPARLIESGFSFNFPQADSAFNDLF